MTLGPVFEVRGLTKAYRPGEAEVHAPRGVDMELDPGGLVVLLGPSGSGKSTFGRDGSAPLRSGSPRRRRLTEM